MTTTELEAQVKDQGDRIKNLTQKLMAARQASAGVRQAQLRQAKLDVLRALGHVLIAVAKDAGKSAYTTERVAWFAGQQHLELCCVAGNVDRYDPTKHDANFVALPGAVVRIVSPGVRFHEGSESFMLIKAVVSPID